MFKNLLKMINNFLPKQTNYVSPLDQFLAAFDQKNPKPSQSQLNLIEKYQRVYALRDYENRDETKSARKIWSGF